ncbi:MAG: hypothetical protein WCV85_04565 [Patescibacteria group bacterium]
MFIPILLFLVFLLVATAAYAGYRAAPWLPTRAADAQRLVDLAGVQSGDVVYELGAGDGRVLLPFTKTQAKSIVGFEISLVPYLIGLFRIRKFRPRVALRFRDFFKVSFNEAQVVYCFLTPKAMAALAPKFRQELQPGTRVLSYAFPIPGWEPEQVSKPTPEQMAIYKYIVGESRRAVER